MKLCLDQDALCHRLHPLLEEPDCREGIRSLAADPFFVAHFLVSVSQGEGLGEAAVGMIGQQEVASLIGDLKRQQAEEHGHMRQTLEAARELFPDYFDDGRYRFEGALDGRDYYVRVLETNRGRLKDRGRYSKLNLYLTTTFGYEVMVILLYAQVSRAVADSDGLPEAARVRVVDVLERILAEEETHLGVLDQHNRLLDAPREGLSPDAVDMLDALSRLGEADYAYPARLSVQQVAAMMGAYRDPAARRLQIHQAA